MAKKKKEKTKEEVLEFTLNEALKDPRYMAIVAAADKQLRDTGAIDDMLFNEITKYWDSKYGVD